jgi:hypothetical protein
MDDARTLLAADPDLTEDEKAKVITEANDAVNDAYAKRYNALVKNEAQPNAQVIDVAGEKVPTIAPYIHQSHDDLNNMENTLQNLKNFKVAQPKMNK